MRTTRTPCEVWGSARASPPRPSASAEIRDLPPRSPRQALSSATSAHGAAAARASEGPRGWADTGAGDGRTLSPDPVPAASLRPRSNGAPASFHERKGGRRRALGTLGGRTVRPREHGAGGVSSWAGPGRRAASLLLSRRRLCSAVAGSSLSLRVTSPFPVRDVARRTGGHCHQTRMRTKLHGKLW